MRPFQFAHISAFYWHRSLSSPRETPKQRLRAALDEYLAKDYGDRARGHVFNERRLSRYFDRFARGH